MISSRRSFLTGLGATLITAPAIVRASSLMQVKANIVDLSQFPIWEVSEDGMLYGRSPMLDALPDLFNWNFSAKQMILRTHIHPIHGVISTSCTSKKSLENPTQRDGLDFWDVNPT